MIYTIKSRKYKTEIDFYCSGKGLYGFGYVYVNFNGSNWEVPERSQICDGGYLRGETIRAREESFEYTCQQWWKQYLRRIKKEVA